MPLISLGWDLPPGYSNPLGPILANVFAVSRDTPHEIARALARLQRSRR